MVLSCIWALYYSSAGPLSKNLSVHATKSLLRPTGQPKQKNNRIP